MKKKVRVLVTGGLGVGNLISAIIANGFDVEERGDSNDYEAMSTELEDIGPNPIFEDVIEQKKDNFIQQKMQGKRRVY